LSRLREIRELSQVMIIGVGLALASALYILFTENGLASLTTEGGFMYVTTFGAIILSMGSTVPRSFQQTIAYLILIIGSLMALNVFFGIELFGLRVVNI